MTGKVKITITSIQDVDANWWEVNTVKEAIEKYKQQYESGDIDFDDIIFGFGGEETVTFEEVKE